MLDEYGHDLVNDAQEILAESPDARVAGMITVQDSREAHLLRDALSTLAGRDLAHSLLVGVVPRRVVEAVLAANVADDLWREQPWQSQQVLPVVVATRDGFRFGLFGLGREAESNR